MNTPRKRFVIRDLIEDDEADRLIQFVEEHRKGQEVGNLVLKWLQDNPQVTKRFYNLGVIKHYGALLLSRHLNLQ